MEEAWIYSPVTATPQEGWELAVKPSRVGVRVTQPSDKIRERFRLGMGLVRNVARCPYARAPDQA